MVYFARVDVAQLRTGWNTYRQFYYIKIGCSVHPEIRMGELKCEYGKPVILLVAIEGGPEEEAAMHRKFEHLRLGPGNWNANRLEWFHPTNELMKFIERLKKKNKFWMPLDSVMTTS